MMHRAWALDEEMMVGGNKAYLPEDLARFYMTRGGRSVYVYDSSGDLHHAALATEVSEACGWLKLSSTSTWTITYAYSDH